MNKNFRKILYAMLACVFVLIAVLLVVSAAGRETTTHKGFLPVSFAADVRTKSAAYAENESGRNSQMITVRGHFEQDVLQNEALWFRVENIGFVLKINGEQVFLCNQPGSFPAIFHAPGYAWVEFYSPGITPDDEVEFEIISYYGDDSQSVDAFLNSFYMGDAGGLYRLLFEKFDWMTLVVLVAMAAGLIYLLEGAIDRLQGLEEGTRIALLGFFAFSGGLWCITDMLYPYFSLVVSPPWLVSVIDMLGLLLFPIALTMLVRYFTRGSMAKKIMNAEVLAAIGLALGALILQLCGMADLRQMQIPLGALGLVMLAVAVFCIISDLRQHHDRYMLMLLIGVAPIFAAIAIDGINLVFPFMPHRNLMKYGFSLSMVLLLWQLVMYANAEAKARKEMQRIKEELLESRISIMLSQIQPHFLYNTLASIRYLCSADPKKAGVVISEFASFLRGNIDSLTSATPILFERELEHLNHYLAIEKVRFSDALNVKTDIRAAGFMLPPLTLQPIVENAIRHGISTKKGGGTVKISTWETEDAVYISIADDGKGFDVNQIKEGGGVHIGIDNVRTRLKMQCGGDMTVESAPGAGTTVTMVIPKGGQNV